MNKKSPHEKIDEAIEEMGMTAAFSYFMHLRMKQRKERKAFLEAAKTLDTVEDFQAELDTRAAAIGGVE